MPEALRQPFLKQASRTKKIALRSAMVCGVVSVIFNVYFCCLSTYINSSIYCRLPTKMPTKTLSGHLRAIMFWVFSREVLINYTIFIYIHVTSLTLIFNFLHWRLLFFSFNFFIDKQGPAYSCMVVA